MPRLSPLQEVLFERWASKNAPNDLNNPEAHYDLRGFWLQNPDFQREKDQHLTDEFKLPGHPTFSRESAYSKGPNDGGMWQNDQYVPALALNHQAPNAQGIPGDQLRRSLIELFGKH
jgi:hypothetical protein